MKALVGHSGFVGSNLKRSASFDYFYNSANIADIGERAFDIVVCAAAPATMWAANNAPEADLANIKGLIGHIGRASIKRLVLISTIAVFDRPAAGYDEINCQFEKEKAYGRHRRLLETEAAGLAEKLHIIRLPALFGEGLKKNFLYDLLNPVPSFLKPEKFTRLCARMSAADAAVVHDYFAEERQLGMFRFDRQRASRDGIADSIQNAFRQVGFLARDFTNSASNFQYYGLDHLWDDIVRCIELDIEVLNFATGPLSAAKICEALTGETFSNDKPPLYKEDMRSIHADAWGGSGPYLRSASETLKAIRSFYNRQKEF